MISILKFVKLYMQLLIQICGYWVLSFLQLSPRLKKGISKKFDENKQDEITQIPFDEYKQISYNAHIYSTRECLQRSEEFYQLMVQRRSVRYFSQKKVPQNIIRNLIKIAGTSPSGANSQPWVYAVISDSSYKKKIRHIIEEQEEINYKQRMGAEWLSQLKPLNTNWIKEYLTDASHIIMLFKRDYNLSEDGTKVKNYYSDISTNISLGILLAAIQYVGLVSVITTPLSCGRALQTLLQRKSNEKLVVLLPVGYPADNATVPDIKRKELHEIIDEY